MSEIVGLAIPVTPRNRPSLAFVNASVVALQDKKTETDHFFILPYDPTAVPTVLPGYAFRENYEFAEPRSDTNFVQIREI